MPPGEAIEIEHGRHLHLTVRPDAPVQLLFTGHMDTVFAADHPFQETRWLEDGVLNGPGVADMKGGIAVMLAALKAVEASPAADRIGYEVVINSDEEVGSLGSAALLARAAQGKRAALTYEPAALPDGTLAGARPGSGNFAFVVHGRSAHAGRNPEDGRNALLAAADLALRLDGAEARRPDASTRRGSKAAAPSNVVPDLAILRVNLRPAHARDRGRGASARSTRRSRPSRPSTTSQIEVQRRLRPPAQAADARGRSAVRAWSSRPAPTSARRSAGSRRAGCATATISPPAACRWSTRWACAAARSTAWRNI